MGLEVLVGVGSSLVTEVYKWLSKKYGFETSRNIVYAFLFIVAVVYVLFEQNGIVDAEAFQRIWATVGSAVGFYELLLKRIQPSLEK